MDITIAPGLLAGEVCAIPSKSQAHRLLICAALSDSETTLLCPQINEDIAATAGCLCALGAGMERTAEGYHVTPMVNIPAKAVMNCHESGSTLRFLLPIVGALGVEATILMEGRLPQRPLSPLWEEMERMGCRLSKPTDNTVDCSGRLMPGDYFMDGGVSSQFISGLLFALPLIGGESRLHITGKTESAPYIDMTRKALALFPGYHSPGCVQVEGDWSNAAFWLAAKALGSGLQVNNLCGDSPQGDRAVIELLPKLKEKVSICAADIPDLVPILSVVAAANRGAVFTRIRRLRMKESDRVESVMAMLNALGGRAEADEDTLTVYGTGLLGGTVDSFGDHRIAMSAAIAATVCEKPVTVLGAECVKKSYPAFWEEFARLGGKI